MKRLRPYVKAIFNPDSNVWVWQSHCPWCKGKCAGTVGHWFRLYEEAMFHSAYCGMKPAKENANG